MFTRYVDQQVKKCICDLPYDDFDDKSEEFTTQTMLTNRGICLRAGQIDSLEFRGSATVIPAQRWVQVLL